MIISKLLIDQIDGACMSLESDNSKEVKKGMLVERLRDYLLCNIFSLKYMKKDLYLKYYTKPYAVYCEGTPLSPSHLNQQLRMIYNPLQV